MSKSQEAAVVEPVEPLVLSAKTMTGDLRDFILDRLKNDHSVIPWNSRKEREQKDLIEQVEIACQRMVRRAVEIIAADGKPVMRGTLVKVLVKDGFKAQIDMLASDPLRHKLIDHQGLTVLVALATPEDFEGSRSAVKVSPDQTSILDDEPPHDPETGEVE